VRQSQQPLNERDWSQRLLIWELSSLLLDSDSAQGGTPGGLAIGAEAGGGDRIKLPGLPGPDRAGFRLHGLFSRCHWSALGKGYFTFQARQLSERMVLPWVMVKQKGSLLFWARQQSAQFFKGYSISRMLTNRKPKVILAHQAVMGTAELFQIHGAPVLKCPGF